MDKIKFFQLLSKYNNSKESSEKGQLYSKLQNYLVAIETNCHYAEKSEYIKLADDFLKNQITADDFIYSFLAIYEGVNNKASKMKKEESLELVNFLEPNRKELGTLLAKIYGDCNAFDIEFENRSTKKDLKIGAEKLLLEL